MLVRGLRVGQGGDAEGMEGGSSRQVLCRAPLCLALACLHQGLARSLPQTKT